MKDHTKSILNLMRDRGTITAPEAARVLGVSRQRAFVILSSMVKNGRLVRSGRTRGTRYAMPNVENSVRDRFDLSLQNDHLKEHEILMQIRDRFMPLKLALENVKSIVDYTFSEMLNNAIEHSGSSKVSVSMMVSGAGSAEEPQTFACVIRDFGVGAFRNLMQKRGLASELEAMQDVLKGKITTAPEAHSGQGIFFSSKAVDRFSLRSYGFEMRVDNTIPDIFFLKEEQPTKGTEVRLDLAYRSPLHLIDVFRAYESEDGEQHFDRTEVLVRLFTHGTIHVSRSQARRILVGLDQFKRVTLDFDRVPSIGQAFADEIFRVFRIRQPQVALIVVNANEAVRFMIDRVDCKLPVQ